MVCIAPPEWFLETQQDFKGICDLEWVPEHHVISDAEMAGRIACEWKLIDQKESPSPTASKEYGRHWIRSCTIQPK